MPDTITNHQPMKKNNGTLLHELRHALVQLEANPAAWSGVRAGWKAQATRARRALAKLQSNPPKP